MLHLRTYKCLLATSGDRPLWNQDVGPSTDNCLVSMGDRRVLSTLALDSFKPRANKPLGIIYGCKFLNPPEYHTVSGSAGWDTTIHSASITLRLEEYPNCFSFCCIELD